MREAEDKTTRNRKVRGKQLSSQCSLTFTDKTIHISLPRTGTNTQAACYHYIHIVLCVQFTSTIN